MNLDRRSLARWISGGLLAFVSVVQALRTLGSMPGRGWSLGGLAIGSLAALTVAGMVGMWRARQRIARELTAMASRPAGGTLVAARRDRLAQIAAVGGTPDVAVLAEESAAAERGQAYLGRFLVAVAVLVGLVGTFSGLAEALRSLPSILGGAAADPQKLAGLLTASLSGLDLTFAAGIVGILSTLALALVQGDLQLHEELALARLEEETAHELVPALWPRALSAEERSARELSALRTEAASMRALLADASTSLASTIASEITRGMKEALRGHAEAQAATAKLGDELRVRAEATATLLTKNAEQTLTLLTKNAEQSALALQKSAELTTAALQKSAELTAGALQKSAELTAGALQKTSEQSAATLQKSTEQSAATLQRHAEQTAVSLQRSAEAAQLTLTVAADRQAVASAAGWTAVKDALVPALDEARASLDSSVRTTIGSLTSGVQSTITILKDTAGETTRALGQATVAFTSTASTELTATRTAITLASDQISASLAGSLHDTAASIAAQLGALHLEIGAQAEVTQRALTIAADRQATEAASGWTSVRDAIVPALDSARTALDKSVLSAVATMEETAIEATRKLGEATASFASTASTELSATRAAITAAADGASAYLGSALADSASRLEALLAQSRGELETTLTHGRESVERMVDGSIGALSSSSAQLAEAATLLSQTSQTLTPQLEALGPELRALTQEVALLGARTEEEEAPLFADELLRVGEGVARLEALVQMAQARGDGAQG